MVKRIGSIKFSCLSPEEIRKMSAVKVITADTYNDEGFPYEGDRAAELYHTYRG
jgi:DNA-directed RNA polymerase subunit A'